MATLHQASEIQQNAREINITTNGSEDFWQNKGESGLERPSSKEGGQGEEEKILRGPEEPWRKDEHTNNNNNT